MSHEAEIIKGGEEQKVPSAERGRRHQTPPVSNIYFPPSPCAVVYCASYAYG